MYSEHSAYFEAFKVYASVGDLHREKDCPGWHLSEVDTWHPCGTCNPGGRKVPHPEFEGEEGEWEAPPEPRVVPLAAEEDDDLPF